jgi:membrane protein
MVPLLIVIIGIIGLVFGQEAAQSAIMSQIRSLVGPQSADAIQDMIQRADQPSTGVLSTILATLTLVVGAAGFFSQLKDALNTVWGIEPKAGRGIWGFLKDNFLSFATLIGTGFLLLVSLIISTALSAFGKWFSGLLPLPEPALQSMNVLVSFIVITGVFALIFKALPDARIAWSDVWVGAALTAALFTVGKFVIGLYLGKSDVGSAYGAAGSLVIVLVWVYYSVQILLYGAEFTEVYANRFGGAVEPTGEAHRVGDDQRTAGAVPPNAEVHGRPAEDAEQPYRVPALHRHRRWLIVGAVAGLVVVAILAAAVLFSGPVKRYAERKVAQALPDYQITIGRLDLHPFKLGVDLKDVEVRLRSHADPALAEAPHVRARVRFLPLFKGNIDVNLALEQPKIAATEQQITAILHPVATHEANTDAGAWQDKLREMMPIRLSLSITDGNATYRSDPHFEPIEFQHLDVAAIDISNRPPENEPYPSKLRFNGRLSDQSDIRLDSRADFLAKPSPRLDGELKVEHLALAALRPLADPYNVQLRHGAMDVTAHLQHASPITVVDVTNLRVEDAKVDYVHTGHTKQKEEPHAQKGTETAKDVHKEPSFVVKVARGQILHSDLGFVNKAASPDYRIFVSDLDLDLKNFSNRPEEGMGTVTLTGNFMGSGPTEVNGSFRPETPNPDFNVRVRIVKTSVDRLNKVLQAHGQMKASQGTFAFFSDMTVKNNRIEGYVKPFLKDVEVYDPEQDKDESTAKKLYEAVVNGVLDLFKNRPSGQVATKTDVSGPVDNPQTSTLQILEKLFENAFFKAILPGFEGQPHAAPA